MVGIISFGAYIPKYRIDRKLIYKAMGWLNPATYMPGERSVANCDEDSLTMAVAASVDCLRGVDRNEVDMLLFASSTAPYLERQNSEILATSIDGKVEIRCADFSGTTKAGTAAVLSALDAAKAGSALNVLVCAADTRKGKAGSFQEEIFGDGAAALLIGQQEVVAEFISSFCVSYDFPDHWRGAGETYDHQWEDRFIRDEGYVRFIVEAVKGLLEKSGLRPEQLTKVIYPCLYGADFGKIAKIIGLTTSQLEEPLMPQVGYTGSADPLLHLVKALEVSHTGDRIAVIGFGAGADAILFQVTDMIETVKSSHRGVAKHLAAKRELKNYEKMIAWRGLLPLEKGIRGEIVAFTALSDLWRNRHEILGLRGGRCLRCGLPQYPPQKVCANPDCGAIGQSESYRFSDKRGTLFTYTGDNLAFSPNPPAIYGLVDFEGGGRFWFDITDADLDEIQVGMMVEMSFRKKYLDEKFGVHGYFWKAIPVLD